MKTQSATKDFFRLFSRKISSIVGHAYAFAGAVLLIIVWLISGPIFHFSDTWQLIINTSTTIITFLIVFLIQNTQNRDIENIQIKLDELIRANKRAHNSVIDLDNLSEEEIQSLDAWYKKLGKADHFAELEDQ